METIQYIEIPAKISFSVSPGQPQTWDDPGYPPEVCDIEYDKAQILREIDKAIFGKDSTIDEDLLEHAEKEARHYDEERADYRYHELKEKGEV